MTETETFDHNQRWQEQNTSMESPKALNKHQTQQSAQRMSSSLAELVEEQPQNSHKMRKPKMTPPKQDSVVHDF